MGLNQGHPVCFSLSDSDLVLCPFSPLPAPADPLHTDQRHGHQDDRGGWASTSLVHLGWFRRSSKLGADSTVIVIACIRNACRM